MEFEDAAEASLDDASGDDDDISGGGGVMCLMAGRRVPVRQ
jgi:hypothetical protein